jgi:hypothetical protein
MLRQIKFLLLAACALALTSVASASQAALIPLHSGDIFPQCSGKTLTGKTLELPSTTVGKTAVVVFSFSRTGGRDSRVWSEHLSKDFPDLSINTIILLESVPKLFRGMALSGIKKAMTSSIMQDRTVVLYQDEALWKHRLAVTDDNRAYLVLLGSDGHIRWNNSAAFSDGAYAQLKNEIQILQREHSHQ